MKKSKMMRHKGQVGLFLALFAVSVLTFADDEPVLNKVSYQLNEEQWVTTSTVIVTVSVDAVLDKNNVETMSQQITENLKKISEKSSWNIVQFNRSQNNSGLEQLYIEAQARLPESELAQLQDHAKKITRPGEAYKILSLEFTPSMAEFEKAHSELRERIYTKAKQEIDRLNQIYPNQRYFLHAVNFNPMFPSQPVATMAGENGVGGSIGMVARKINQMSMTKSAKVTETANVIIASEVPSSKK